MVRGSSLELMDHTFDGHEDSISGDLRNGLGQVRRQFVNFVIACVDVLSFPGFFSAPLVKNSRAQELKLKIFLPRILVQELKKAEILRRNFDEEV